MTAEAFIVVVLAPFVGSFLGVVIDRLPEGRPIIAGRSACDTCGYALGWTDLLPLLSFLLLRGSCRYCNTRLRIFYPLIELAAIAVALSAAFVLSGWLLILSVGLGWSLLALAVIDHRHLVLPDGLTLPLIPAGLAVAYMIEPGLLKAHIIGGAVGLLVFLGIAWLYRYLRGREGLGMGDAKLLAGAGAWLGWPALPGVVLLAAVSALCITFLRILSGDRMAINGELPFGGHLAFSFWASWLIGPLTLA
ncbi:MAG: prepilin peptidase [Geminicoccaceae bacterium]